MCGQTFSSALVFIKLYCMSDNFEADQIGAAEMAKQDLNKFRLYFDRLKERFSSQNGTIILVETDKIGQIEFDVYKKFVTFIKSINKENYNLDDIATKSSDLITEAKKCSEKNFSAWIKNEIMPLTMIKYLATNWEGDGTEEDKSLKFVVDFSVANTDPENLY